MTHYTNTNNTIDFPKSKLKRVKGDLLEMASQGKFDVIIHGCNCFNAMGAGIARQIRKTFPQAYAVDMNTTRGDYNKLGNYTLAHVELKDSDFVIINAYTQFDTSRSYDVFEYAAFELLLKKITYVYGSQEIGLPMIGMGLAGGDSKRIMPMLEAFSKEVDERGGSVTLVEYQP